MADLPRRVVIEKTRSMAELFRVALAAKDGLRVKVPFPD
jgi:hypothetical protein